MYTYIDIDIVIVIDIDIMHAKHGIAFGVHIGVCFDIGHDHPLYIQYIYIYTYVYSRETYTVFLSQNTIKHNIAYYNIISRVI